MTNERTEAPNLSSGGMEPRSGGSLQMTPALPSRAAIYFAVNNLTNAFSWPPGSVGVYLARLYPMAPGPDVGGDPRNPEVAARQMQEIANG